jgi:hypothetical protein
LFYRSDLELVLAGSVTQDHKWGSDGRWIARALELDSRKFRRRVHVKENPTDDAAVRPGFDDRAGSALELMNPIT